MRKSDGVCIRLVRCPPSREMRYARREMQQRSPDFESSLSGVGLLLALHLTLLRP